nr:immunoglobulin heavy chain junction region [Macaca mulatta]
CARDQSNIDVW